MKRLTMTLASLVVFLSPLSLLAFKSEKRPILYPNAHYETMGIVSAQADIEDCWTLARETGANENSDDQVSQDAANDAATLAVAGAAAAAVLGGDPHRAAIAGAAGGGAASFLAGRVYQNDPPPVFRQIVERCLFEKGYEVAGWE